LKGIVEECGLWGLFAAAVAAAFFLLNERKCITIFKKEYYTEKNEILMYSLM